LGLFGLLLHSPWVHAVNANKWHIEGFKAADIETYHGVMYDVETGRAEPGAATDKHIYADGQSFWAGAVDAQGDLVLGGGQPAQLVVFSNQAFKVIGSRLLQNAKSVSALLALQNQNTILVGLSNGGKILQLDKGRYLSALCELPAEHIWALVDNQDGYVYAATGPLGAIFRIDPETGHFERWVQTQDTNIRLLYRSAEGRLLFGGAERGNLYEIKGKGVANVVAHFPEASVVAAVTLGEGLLVATSQLRETPEEKQEALYKAYFKQFSELNRAFGTDDDTGILLDPVKNALAGLSHSALYWVGPNHQIDRLLEFKDEYILDMLWQDDQLLVSTGPEGRVYLLKDVLQDDRKQLLAHDFPYKYAGKMVDAQHILVSGNEAGFYTRQAQVKQAHIISKPFSPGMPTLWGQLYWQGSGLTVYSRHGNTTSPDDTWTDWILRGQGVPAELPQSVWNFSQVKIDITERAHFDSLDYYYVEYNQRPRVLNMTIADKKQTDAGWFQDITWEMEDPNEDRLQVRISIQPNDQTHWLELTETPLDNVTTYALPLARIADGQYTLKVSVSDDNVNVGSGLSSFALSDPVTIDQHAPTIERLHLDPTRHVISAQVTDNLSILKTFEVSFDGQYWRAFQAADGVLDERVEEMQLTLPEGFKNKRSISVRVTDEAGNATIRTVHMP